MSQLDVVTFGEAMAMFIADEPGPLHEVNQYTRALAGAETNVAIGIARLGLKSGWASKVGDDAFGKFITQKMQQEQVNIDQVLSDGNFSTGFQIKSKVFSGDPEVSYFRKGSAASHMGADDLNEGYFLSARHLHMTGIPLAISQDTRAFAVKALKLFKEKGQGRTISFDPNLRPKLWTSKEEMIAVTNQVAQEAHYVLPGIGEGEILTGYNNPRDIALFYLDKGVKLVIIKLGEKGAFYKTANDEGFVQGFEVPQVIDTVGAGDGFAVGVISGLLENLPIREAVVRGNAIGSLAVQSQGDHDGYPTRLLLENYLKENFEGVI